MDPTHVENSAQTEKCTAFKSTALKYTYVSNRFGTQLWSACSSCFQNVSFEHKTLLTAQNIPPANWRDYNDIISVTCHRLMPFWCACWLNDWSLVTQKFMQEGMQKKDKFTVPQTEEEQVNKTCERRWLDVMPGVSSVPPNLLLLVLPSSHLLSRPVPPVTFSCF